MSQRHFGGENVIAVIVHHEFKRECRSGGNKLSDVKVHHFAIGRRLNLLQYKLPFSTNFFGEKKLNEAFLGVFF